MLTNTPITIGIPTMLLMTSLRDRPLEAMRSLNPSSTDISLAARAPSPLPRAQGSR